MMAQPERSVDSSAAGAALAVPKSAPALVSDTVLVRTLTDDPHQLYLLYRPRSASANAPVLVTVHGISRNAFEQVAAFAGLARCHGIVVVAPVFTERRQPRYQRLMPSGPEPRADQALDRIVAEARKLSGVAGALHLFGYSGGAQFVHRYAMAHPERVHSAAVAAAGWYTFPDPSLDYPYGIRSTADLAELRFDPRQFLRVPIHVFVGALDVKRDPGLRQSERVDRQQGLSRVERACRWAAAMRAGARKLGLATDYSSSLLPRSSHSFAHSVRRDQLAERVFAALGLASHSQPGMSMPRPDSSTVNEQFTFA